MNFWDAHGCFPINRDSDLSELALYHEVGVRFLSINIGMDFNSIDLILDTVAQMRKVFRDRDDVDLVKDYQSVEDIQKQNKIALAFDLEGSVMLNDNPNRVDLFYDLGVRQMHLAYNKNNSIAGGCMDTPQGITELGSKVIERMNKVGMVLDLSHMGKRATMEAMEMCQKPPVFSHSNALGLCEHPRNIDDEQAKKCAELGGVIGVNGIGKFLNGKADCATSKICDHIDYFVQLVDDNHVGVGLDYVVDKTELIEFIEQNPDSFKGPINKSMVLSFAGPSFWQEVDGELAQRGYSVESISKILGNNFKRIAKENWR